MTMRDGASLIACRVAASVANQSKDQSARRALLLASFPRLLRKRAEPRFLPRNSRSHPFKGEQKGKRRLPNIVACTSAGLLFCQWTGDFDARTKNSKTFLVLVSPGLRSRSRDHGAPIRVVVSRRSGLGDHRTLFPLLERAARGELDYWAQASRSRLALIIVLDQFSRSLYRDTARAFAQIRGLSRCVGRNRDRSLRGPRDSPWEKTFFFLPFGHSEELRHLEEAVKLAEDLVEQAPAELRKVLQHWRRRPADTATLSRASAAIRIATLSWRANRLRRNSTIWPAANSCTCVRFRHKNRQ